MRNIDIVKPISKARGKLESLITYVTDCKGNDMCYPIDPAKSHNELGCMPKLCLWRLSGRLSNGIWITGRGGKSSSATSIRIIMRRCMGIDNLQEKGRVR